MNEADAAAGSLSGLLALLVSSGSAGPDLLVFALTLSCCFALVIVHGTVGIRLIRIAVLTRDINTLYESRASGGREGLLRDLDRTFAGSLLAENWTELMRRRRELEAHAPEARAAIRFSDLLIERPLIPLGIRKRAMRVMPGLFAALGLAATLAILAGGLGSAGGDAPIAAIVGGSLRGAFWGVAMAALAATLTAALEGTADAQAVRLSLLIERSYRSLTPVEAQLRAAEAQRLGFERVSSLLVQVAQDLRDSLDRGLGRIERSTANAANLVGEEQRRVLELVIEDLSGLLRRGVEDQVGALRSSLKLAAEQQATLGERVVKTIDGMSAGAETNVRVSGALERAAQAVDEAAGTIAGSADELKPLIVHLAEVASTLERAAGRVEKAEALADPADTPSTAMLSALRDDLAVIGAQFLEGATALRQSVEPFRQQGEALGERGVAQALEDLDERAGSLRQRFGDETSGDRRNAAPVPPEPTAERDDTRDAERDLRRGAEGDAALAEARAGEPAERPALDVPDVPPALDAPDVLPALEPAGAPGSERRGGDLASALARSGEALQHGDDRDAATPDEPAKPISAPSAPSETGDADLEAVGRGGFSALLSRYKAPQFSIDELPPELREFTADDAERRAREAGTRAEAAADEAESDETASAGATEQAHSREEASKNAPDSDDVSEAEADRRRRLDRFLGSR